MRNPFVIGFVSSLTAGILLYYILRDKKAAL
jgi:hypothetical protein